MTRTQVAIAQTGPVLFDVERSLDKVADWTARAARQGAKLVLFPEAMVAAYPKGAMFGSYFGGRTREGRDLYRRYLESACEMPGSVTERLAQISGDNGIALVVGVIERDGGTIFCTVAHFDETGRFLGRRRKLMPTGAERLAWGFGDLSDLRAYDTGAGRIASVICWENYMPLLRTATYDLHPQIYCAPTLDERECWTASMRHIAIEGRCFVLSACQALQRRQVPDDATDYFADADPDAWICRGRSCIVDPFGKFLAEPLVDAEGLLTAELDMDEIARGKFDFDVTGHYARPDLFQLRLDTRKQLAVTGMETSA
ncbi:carbon-nitrogen hydrolase family protein [Nisaea sediminum]|uniref:carbon-nitrogen hydrolase family protein n=1 Tax=Nisaea sediminum TaxID=2775867 RepID=UPI001866C61F|nr:carbon-nitrogen hydrolase family protein [Nisaea sediminum]